MILGWLIIPAIALYAPIYAAPIDDAGTLTRADDYHVIEHPINHLEGTTWVDDGWGQVVLAAHSHGWFRDLDQLQPGDLVIIYTSDASYQFEITDSQIVGNDTHLLAPTPSFTITLLTCADRGETWLATMAQPLNTRP